MNIRLLFLLSLAMPLAACGDGVSAPAADSPAPAAARPAADVVKVAEGDPRIALAALIPGAEPEDLRATPLPGIYELVHGTDISYISEDAKYVLSGNLFQVTDDGDFPNLTEQRRRELRAARIAEIPESRMLTFGRANAAHTITVFTDIDCQWCQRLHSQVQEYNQLGIRVRYLFFPRTGPETESWYKAETVWCARDRNQAMTRAKRGDDIGAKRDCADTPVEHDYQLGRELGVRGTPGVVLENGELVPGYLAPADMLAHIRESLSKVPTGR